MPVKVLNMIVVTSQKNKFKLLRCRRTKWLKTLNDLCFERARKQRYTHTIIRHTTHDKKKNVHIRSCFISSRPPTTACTTVASIEVVRGATASCIRMYVGVYELIHACAKPIFVRTFKYHHTECRLTSHTFEMATQSETHETVALNRPLENDFLCLFFCHCFATHSHLVFSLNFCGSAELLVQMRIFTRKKWLKNREKKEWPAKPAKPVKFLQTLDRNSLEHIVPKDKAKN